MHVTLTDIRSLEDERYDAYLDLYQTSFPLNEQMLVSALNRTVREIASGEETASAIVVAPDDAGEVVAMAHYEAYDERRGAVLWYLAVALGKRGIGIGSGVYKAITARILRERPSTRAFVYEIERPEDAEGHHRTLAERRIAFYRRNGAKLLGGIRYTQSVGWQPPVPMHVMVHEFERLSPEAAYEMARSLLGEAVEQVGPLALE